MKTLILPRTMSHVHRDGMTLCVTCQHTCFKGFRCECCKEKL